VEIGSKSQRIFTKTTKKEHGLGLVSGMEEQQETGLMVGSVYYIYYD
jgi:hypothetical protein